MPALLASILILAWAGPAYALPEAHRPGHVPKTPPSTRAKIDLYAPRVRRSTASYLRLRLLELREAGLDRARAAIERRLSIDELLAEPRSPRPRCNTRRQMK